MTLEKLLPKAARVNKFIPKSKFYEKTNVNKQIKDEFISKIQKITWKYKLAESTIGINKTENVTEIQIFDIELKQQYIPKKALKIIDSSIPYQILYRFSFKNYVSYGISLKKKKKPENYYFSEWNNEIDFDFDGTDLEIVYQKIIKSFIRVPFKESDNFIKIVQKDKQVKLLQTEITSIEQKITKEQQLNRKVDLNKTLKQKKKELDMLLEQDPNNDISH